MRVGEICQYCPDKVKTGQYWTEISYINTDKEQAFLSYDKFLIYHSQPGLFDRNFQNGLFYLT